MSAWARDVVRRSVPALAPFTNADRAAGAFAYMKGVAPFLGVSAPDRRRALRQGWKGLRQPTSEELGDAALALMAQREREYHYAAYDLIERYRSACNANFLPRYGARLLTTKPWWDTVDGLVNVMVSPLVRRYGLDSLMGAWSTSGDRWLIRAAIGHQRGWKADTDIRSVLQLCDAHWSDREFFIAKAIGWALRDVARMNPKSVRAFLDVHDASNRVAIREAERGLATM